MKTTCIPSPCDEPSKGSYQRRQPELSVLSHLVSTHLQSFINALHQDERGLPAHVLKEFRAYLDCGILARGFILRRCLSCNFGHLVAFSCRQRGFCPSCLGRRSALVAAHLVDHVIPKVAVRQWVVTLPIHLRYLVAHNRPMQTLVHRVVTSSSSQWYRRSASKCGGVGPQAGFTSFTQYASSDLSLNPHFHILFLDGAYGRTSDGSLRFFAAPNPQAAEVEEVLGTIARRIIALLIRRELLTTTGEWLEVPDLAKLSEDHPLYARLLHASTLGYVPMTGQLGFQRVRKLAKGYGFLGETALFKGPQCASQNGFTLHCARRVKAQARRELEELIRYATRPPLAEKRLTLLPSGEISYTMKRTFSDGTRELLMTPFAFLSKLASIIPPPWHNLTRFGGILAPAARDRSAVVPSPSVPAIASEDDPKVRRNYPWSALLKRIFGVDLTLCPRCGGTLKSLAAITDPASIITILRHFGLSADPPVAGQQSAPAGNAASA